LQHCIPMSHLRRNATDKGATAPNHYAILLTRLESDGQPGPLRGRARNIFLVAALDGAENDASGAANDHCIPRPLPPRNVLAFHETMGGRLWSNQNWKSPRSYVILRKRP
jgi:hypothetical protein